MKKAISLVKLLLAIMFATVLSQKVSSQEISKTSEIYDNEIGDVIQYYEWGKWYSALAVDSHVSISILDKYYSQETDTLIYIREISGDATEYGYPHDTTTYFSYIDTVKYFNLDSAVNYGNIDTVYSDPNKYNGRTINYYETYSGYWDYEEMEFINGCGGPYNYYYRYEPLWEDIEGGRDLTYFLKGNEEWGTPFFVKIPENQVSGASFRIYPNPAKNSINIKLPSTINNYMEIRFYSINGGLVKSIVINRNQNTKIDISDLSSGLYLMSIFCNDEIFQTRFIKN